MDESTNGYPWPQKGDDPFALGSSRRATACVNFFGVDQPWRFYAEGYKLAADTLVAHVDTTGRDHDRLVYPIIFNYRQYIELALKGVIRDARKLLDERGGAPTGHVLTDLWNTARPLLWRIAPNKADLDTAGESIKRFAAVDPTSEGFRYPVTVVGTPALPKALKNVDLVQVRQVVERLDGFLDVIDFGLGIELDHRSDALAIEYEMQLGMEATFATASATQSHTF
jgi:hypothetical protein